MLRLTVGPPRTPPNSVPTAVSENGAPPVQAGWHDGGDRGYVDVRSVGRFDFPAEADRDGGNTVTARPEPGVPEVTVRAAFLSTALPLVLQARGEQLLHASAVEDRRGGVVAFCGPSQAGKSTLGRGLALRGFRQRADDAVLLRRSADGTFHAAPLAWQPRLRPDVASLLAGPAAGSAATTDTPPLPLRHIHLLRREPGRRRVGTAPVSPADALGALVDHAYRFDAGPKRTRALLTTYLDLAAAVPVTRLLLPDDLDRLHATLDGVADLLRGGGPPTTLPHPVG